MAYWFLLNFANAGIFGTFFQRDLREIVLMNNSWVNAVLVVMPCIGWYMAVKWWGRARDRWGNKPILVVASIAVATRPLAWCLVLPGTKFLGLLIPIYGGFVWAGIDMALCNALFEFSGQGRVSSYPALASIISGLGGIIGPLIAGLLGQWLGMGYVQIGPFHLPSYHVLFILGAALQAITIPLALRIEEPSAASTKEVLRALYANAAAMTRTFGYFPRRLAASPLMMMSSRTQREWQPAAQAPAIAHAQVSRVTTRHGMSQLYTRQSGIYNGVHPSNYNDYITQLVEQAGKEIADQLRARKAAVKLASQNARA